MTLTLVAGSSAGALAERVAADLGISCCRRTVERFADSELHVRIDQSVRGHDVYVIQATAPPVDEHLMEVLFLADACRRAGAARLTAVLPYFGYARQDRRAAGREPVGARLAAQLLEGAGFSRVIAVDLHTPEIEGFFHMPVEHLTASLVLTGCVRAAEDTVIVAPDLGAVKLAERYQSVLQRPVAIVHKTRISGSEVTVRSIVGDVKGRSPLIVDDMITTGGTVEAAVKALLVAGCNPGMCVVATHGLFVGPAAARLNALPIRTIATTDTVPPGPGGPARVQVTSIGPLIATTIARLHRDQSLETLLVRS